MGTVSTGVAEGGADMHVVPENAHAGLSEMTGYLGDREKAVAASVPRLTAPVFGAGLAARGAEIVALFADMHDNRLAHLQRLRNGVADAEGVLRAVEQTEGASAGSLKGGVS